MMFSILVKIPLNLKEIKLENLNDHNIEVVNSKVIVLHVNNDSLEVMKELANTQNAIVHKSNCNASHLLSFPSTISGLFTYKIEEGALILKPNKFNWRVTPQQSQPTEIKIIPLNHYEKHTAQNPDFEVIIGEPEEFNIRHKNTNSMIAFKSNIVGTMYLRIMNDTFTTASQEEIIEMIHYLHEKIKRENLIPNSLKNIYVPSHSFFPGVEIKTEEHTSYNKSSNIEKIFLSGPSTPSMKKVLSLIKKELIQMGITTEIITLNKELKQVFQGKSIHFNLAAQHLSGDISEVLHININILKMVADIEGNLKKVLIQHSENRETITDRDIATKFHLYNNLPLFHYHKAIYASDKRLGGILGKENGRIHFNEILNTLLNK